MKKVWVLLFLSAWLGACATTTIPSPTPSPPGSKTPAPSIPTPSPKPPLTPEPITPPQTPPNTNPSNSTEINDDFAKLALWPQSDVKPALLAFRRNCEIWNTKSPSDALSARHPEFGKISDWLPVCAYARRAGHSGADAMAFFETHFSPIVLSAIGSNSGLLTGYYQPEINVRAAPDAQFSEAILAVPTRDSDRSRPRSQIQPYMARVIAYGRPIDVFFMQIQGSGVLAFENGYRLRAAYAANNGRAYTSIGGVLVKRGEMTLDQASKQAIEAWMQRNGPAKTKALMNENERYIFFRDEKIVSGEGPMGAMRVPLTGMGSIAVDPTHYPYGLPLFVQVNIPQFGGDYGGRQQGQLLIAQDTGKAIRGARRGDIYFGEGVEAGAKAGVMKHRGQWAMLVPKALIGRLPAS